MKKASRRMLGYFAGRRSGKKTVQWPNVQRRIKLVCLISTKAVLPQPQDPHLGTPVSTGPSNAMPLQPTFVEEGTQTETFLAEIFSLVAAEAAGSAHSITSTARALCFSRTSFGGATNPSVKLVLAFWVYTKRINSDSHRRCSHEVLVLLKTAMYVKDDIGHASGSFMTAL